MKKIILLIAIIVLLSVTFADAGNRYECFWIWDTDYQNETEDAPDDVYCSFNSATFVSYSGSHVQGVTKAKTIQITYDTVTPDGVNTIGDLHSDITDTQVICENLTAVADLNIHSVINGTADAGTYYHEEEDMGVDDVVTFGLTPSIDAFKLTVTESNSDAGCLVVYTVVEF